MSTTIPSGGGNLILGNNLSESISGTTSNDTVYGYAGDDTISGNSSNDYIDGGLGDDSIRGDAGDDTILGGLGNDTILGGSGNDSVFGGNGDDSISGSAGDDFITGGNGLDTLRGAKGADLINAGGNDVLRYVNSNDGSTFLFDFNSNASFDNAVAAGGYDIITNFNSLGAGVGNTFDFTSSFTPLVNDFASSVFPSVQSGSIGNFNFLPGTNRLFAYDTGVDTYLMYDQNTFNDFGGDTNILAKLVGVTGAATLNTNDFSFSV